MPSGWCAQARHIEVQIVGDGKGGVVAAGRARMQPAAAQPEDRRARAQPRTCGRRCASRSSTRRVAMAQGRAATAASAPSSSWSTAQRRLLLHRGQSAPAGRAHRHRGGVGRRSGAGAVAAGRRRVAGRARPRSERRAARPCDPAARQHGDHDARTARPSRAAARSARSSRRRGRACASTPMAMPATAPIPNFDSLLAKVIVHARAELRRRAGAGRARAGDVPASRARRPTSPSCAPAGRQGRARRQGPYALRRRARRRS